MNKTKVKINYIYSKKKQEAIINNVSEACGGLKVTYEDGNFYVHDIPEGQTWEINLDANIHMVECHDRPLKDKIVDVFK